MKRLRRPVAAVRQPPTDSLRSLHAGLQVPTGRRRLVGANKKKEKKGKRKKNWQAVRNQREANSNRIERKKRRGGGNCSVRARSRRLGRLHQPSFMRPSSSHTYMHKRTRFYRQMAIVPQSTMHRHMYSVLRDRNGFLRTPINKKRTKSHRKAFGLSECSRRARLSVATTPTITTT
ncbi:Uncharacterized protein APZ42_008298 [Daphnia magna]|uniref:Uncharacterized protein n=1 Tax=Daphnia magna TaxID=35525 RepID=A0A164ER66_9CRUS|nr:Uncharacterized protein APZ42_008298 [Daphnia magna]